MQSCFSLHHALTDGLLVTALAAGAEHIGCLNCDSWTVRRRAGLCVSGGQVTLGLPPKVYASQLEKSSLHYSRT